MIIRRAARKRLILPASRVSVVEIEGRSSHTHERKRGVLDGNGTRLVPPEEEYVEPATAEEYDRRRKDR